MDHPYGESRWTPRYLLTIYPDEDGNCGGFYQQVFRQELVPFSEITQMILQIDHDISTNGKLYAPDRFRVPDGWGSGRVPKPAAPKTAFAPRKREKGGRTGSSHFLVTIHYCRNATWQGEIRWREKNLRRDFRSCLELTRMIEDAVANR